MKFKNRELKTIVRLQEKDNESNMKEYILSSVPDDPENVDMDKAGTPLNAENLNQGNWRDDTSLSFTKRADHILPVSDPDRTQIVTDSENNTWIIPPDSSDGHSEAFKLEKRTELRIDAVNTLEAGSQAYVTIKNEDGISSLNFGIPKGEKGEEGTAGKNGNSFQVIGTVDTVSELETLKPNARPGDAYFVGTTLPRSIYAFDMLTGEFQNQGILQGEQGLDGFGIYRTDYSVVPNSITQNIPINMIQVPAGRNLKVADYVIDGQSRLYYINKISGNLAKVTFMHNLKGASGTTLFSGSEVTGDGYVSSQFINGKQVIEGDIYINTETHDLYQCNMVQADMAYWGHLMGISGDVIGPNQSKPESIVVFNGTDGKTIKDSGFAINGIVKSDIVNNFSAKQVFSQGAKLGLNSALTGQSALAEYDLVKVDEYFRSIFVGDQQAGLYLNANNRPMVNDGANGQQQLAYLSDVNHQKVYVLSGNPWDGAITSAEVTEAAQKFCEENIPVMLNAGSYAFTVVNAYYSGTASGSFIEIELIPITGSATYKYSRRRLAATSNISANFSIPLVYASEQIVNVSGTPGNFELQGINVMTYASAIANGKSIVFRDSFLKYGFRPINGNYSDGSNSWIEFYYDGKLIRYQSIEASEPALITTIDLKGNSRVETELLHINKNFQTVNFSGFARVELNVQNSSARIHVGSDTTPNLYQNALYVNFDIGSAGYLTGGYAITGTDLKIESKVGGILTSVKLQADSAADVLVTKYKLL